MTSKGKTILVLGGGVGGLMAAHALAQAAGRVGRATALTARGRHRSSQAFSITAQSHIHRMPKQAARLFLRFIPSGNACIS